MLFDNQHFAHLYAHAGKLALARLALVTIVQFTDDLSDMQAAEAVRDRISWKYLLGLPLDDPGFDASVLSEFAPVCSRMMPRPCCLTTHIQQVLTEVAPNLLRILDWLAELPRAKTRTSAFARLVVASP